LRCCKRCQKYWMCQDAQQNQNGLYEQSVCCDLCNNYLECKRITEKRILETKDIDSIGKR